MMDVTLETMHTPLQVDFSTGDVITPGEVDYSFQLLFEERTISILAYNLETVLAEKLETVLARGTLNTRMRDFYDIYALATGQSIHINTSVLREAFRGTTKKRGSAVGVHDAAKIIDEIEASPEMIYLWKKYRNKYDWPLT